VGIVTEATLKLLPRPRHVATALVCFPDVDKAAPAVSRVLAEGVIPRCLELIDDVSVQAISRGSPFQLPPGAGAALLFETDGNDEEQVFAEMARVAEMVQGSASGEVVVAQNDAQRREIWETRKYLSVALGKLRPRKLGEDVAVPRSRIPEMVARSREIGRAHGLLVATYGHAGDGNLHCNVLFDGDADKAAAEAAVADILRAAVDMGGTITGEHGVGLAKRDFLAYEQGEAVLELERRIKAGLDPLGILKPGKMFPET
jgi:glycolate oxidase